jgi:DNA-binding transcriptional ArsR family regulator
MNTFYALADPTRRHIVELLGRGEQTAGAIGEKFSVSAPAISQHLKVLREAQLVRVRAQGQHRIYSLDPAGLDEIDAWLQRTRSFWAKSLDALERELSKPAVTPKNKTRRKR